MHTLAQARTSTVILRLDAEHNESVTRFLIDSGLVSSEASDSLLREITLSHATLSDAILVKADLSNADLSNASLRGADLSNASLFRVDLSNTFLVNADLSDALGTLNTELEQQDAYLEGATMPDGQKYEDWLKDREKRQQDE